VPIHQTRYTLAEQSNLRQAATVTARADLTYSQARDVLRHHVIASPSDESRYQVVAGHEAVPA
jgi:hypothetical protein